MRTRIIKIGNSQGVRIPKAFLEHAGLDGEVELEAQNNQILIRSAEEPRKDWESAFRQMSDSGDDQLLDEDLTGQTVWDEEEWNWE